MKILLPILAAVLGYLLGCIPVGVLVGKLYHNSDIRKSGSGSTGTTNVLRTLGWVPSLLTFAGDCVKGVLAAWLGKLIGGEAGMLAGGFCAVLGHDFPVFMRFKGGKGIVTSLGITLIICPIVAPFLVVITIGTVAILHTMSIGSLLATLAYPILFWIFLPETANFPLYMIFSAAMAALSVYCHRGNIMRLIRGKENKLDFAKISKISKENAIPGKKK